MRDLFFLALLPLMLYAMAKRPFVALGMWIWTAMFFPNAWLYGMGASFRYNLLFTAFAIVGYLALRNKPKVVFGPIGGLVLLFLVWTTVSTALTVGSPEVAWDIWNRFSKVILLFLFIVLIVEKKLHIDFFLGCVVLSVGFYGCLEALKFVVSGGGHQINGFSGHVLGDRNELSLAFVMTLPMCFYLQAEYGKESTVLRYGLLGAMGLIVAAIIGTQSRGGFVALLGLGAYMFMKSDRKILLAVLIAILTGVLSQFISQEWTTRMDTIGEATEDASFMGRVVAWKLSFILAAQNPFFGGGFKALEHFTVWQQLCQEFFSYPFFYTGDALPNPELPRAAHSVYFQVLGDHGFGGLALFLALVARAFLTARQVAKRARGYPETAWIANLATMLQLSVFAFCLGGAALSFAYFELLYAIFGIILVLDKRILPAAIAALSKSAASASGQAVSLASSALAPEAPVKAAALARR